MNKISLLTAGIVLLTVTICSADTVRIQVLFEESTKYGAYQDAIYYTEAEYAAVKQADIDAEKVKRVAAYEKAVEEAPAPVEPTLEELQAEKSELEARLTEVEQKITEKEAP